MTNDWGDVELDAKGMRALAHPVRLAILGHLREHGPDTATGLAPHVGASPSVTSWHLRHLAEHGLVEDAPGRGHGRQRWWQAVGWGFRSAAAQDPGAHRVLSRAVELAEGDLVGSWSREVEPRLEPEWVAAAGRWNTRIAVTPQEVAHIDAAIEAVLAPFVHRQQAGDVPPDTRRVRILRYTMPEGPPT
jgi:DNA-binding transcriptional ArsR family regulator